MQDRFISHSPNGKVFKVNLHGTKWGFKQIKVGTSVRDEDDLGVGDIKVLDAISISVVVEVSQTLIDVDLVDNVYVPSGTVTQKIGIIPEKVGFKVVVLLVVL